jgi:hypothetical protein
MAKLIIFGGEDDLNDLVVYSIDENLVIIKTFNFQKTILNKFYLR